jgi:hypothetical protein
LPHHDPGLDVSLQEITFDQMTFRILLLQSADEVRAQIISEYSSADKQISIWSDDEAVDNVVTAFRQAINRGQSGPDLAGAVCNSIIANQPLELTGHRNRSPDATAANSVLAYRIFILMAKLDPRLLPQKVKDQLGRSFSNPDFASSQLTANLLTAAYGDMGRCWRAIRLFTRLVGCR